MQGPQDSTTQITAYVVLTNNSSSPCTTSGYPGVDFIDKYGTSAQSDLKMQTTREDSGSAAKITIAAGDQATATIQYNSGSVCPAGADTVQVIPPNQTTTLHAPIDFLDSGSNPPSGFAVCSTNIDVWPLQSGYDGPHQ
jgi:hypothetical protein